MLCVTHSLLAEGLFPPCWWMLPLLLPMLMILHVCGCATGKVAKIRLLGDFAHSTRIAFVEFADAEGAMAALNCSGAMLGERQTAWPRQFK
jgi:hypothetical protein